MKGASEHFHFPLGMPLIGASLVHLQYLDGTMTDLFIHLVAYQLVTLSGTGMYMFEAHK